MTKTNNKKLLDWVAEVQAMCKPDNVEWADGSTAEYDRLMQLMVDCGMATKLNDKTRPNSFLFRSDPSDVARVEGRTYIACKNEEEADHMIDEGQNRRVTYSRPLPKLTHSINSGHACKPLAKNDEQTTRFGEYPVAL